MQGAGENLVAMQLLCSVDYAYAQYGSPRRSERVHGEGRTLIEL